MSTDINIDELIDDFDSLTTSSFSPVYNKSTLQPHRPNKSKSPNLNPKNKFAVLPENLSPNSRKNDDDHINSLLSEVLNSPVVSSSSSYVNSNSNVRLFSPSPVEKINYSSSSSRKNSLDDDLLNMIDDSDNNSFRLPGMKSSSRPLSENLSKDKKYDTSTSEKQRCCQVYLGGNSILRGLKTSSFSHTVCDSLLCTECNFKINYYSNHVWDSDKVDYLFFRLNMPNDNKLKAFLIKKNDCISYCCQCSWISISNRDLEKNIKDIKSSIQNKDSESKDIISFGGNLQWSCMGHNAYPSIDNEDKREIEDDEELNIWSNFLQYSSAKAIQFLHPFLTASTLSKNAINVYDISTNIFVLGNDGVGKKKLINGLATNHNEVNTINYIDSSANQSSSSGLSISFPREFADSLSYNFFKIVPPSHISESSKLSLQFNSPLMTRANLYGVDQRLSSFLVSDILSNSLSRGDNLAAIVVVDLSNPDEALVSAKQWLLRLHSLLMNHPNFSSTEIEGRIDSNDEKFTEILKKMNRHYLLSTRVHKGSYFKVLNEIVENDPSSNSEHIYSPCDSFYKILDDPQSDKSPNSPYYLSSKFFPIPVIIVGTNIEKISQTDPILVKKLYEAKSKLRLLALAVGASFLCGSDSDNVHYFAKNYLVHRLFPHIVSLQTLKIYEDKKDFLFVPSGFESIECIERSYGQVNLRIDYNELINYFTSTSLDSLTQYNPLINDKIDLSELSHEDIESEQDWLESLYTHIKKIETSNVSKSTSSISEYPLTSLVDEEKNIKSLSTASTTPTAGNRRPSVRPAVTAPSSSEPKDVKNFFNSFLSKK